MKNLRIAALTIAATLLVVSLTEPFATALAGTKHHLNFEAIDGGKILHVPQDHATIQRAVDAAADGNTILVAACGSNPKEVGLTLKERRRRGEDLVPFSTRLTCIRIHVL